MPTVYRSETSTRFHRSRTCKQLKRPSIKGIIEQDLDDVRGIPCRTCYPDAPKVSSIHRRCSTCGGDTNVPCAHNGGVLVRQEIPRRQTLMAGPGETYVRYAWVWPEHAHLSLNS